MTFKGGELCGLNNLLGHKRLHCRFIDPGKNISRMLIECAILCGEKGTHAFWDIQALLMKFIDMATNFSEKVSDDTYKISESSLTFDKFHIDAESYIMENISSNILNADIARHVNLSTYAFIHKFKKSFGVSPRSKILSMKIQLAREMIRKGKRLNEIAESLGFYDQFHMSKTFKKITGVPPMQFKKEPF